MNVVTIPVVRVVFGGVSERPDSQFAALEHSGLHPRGERLRRFESICAAEEALNDRRRLPAGLACHSQARNHLNSSGSFRKDKSLPNLLDTKAEL